MGASIHAEPKLIAIPIPIPPGDASPLTHRAHLFKIDAFITAYCKINVKFYIGVM